MNNTVSKSIMIGIISLLILSGFNPSLGKHLESKQPYEDFNSVLDNPLAADFFDDTDLLTKSSKIIKPEGIYGTDNNFRTDRENFSGYIVQFYEKPVLIYQTELESATIKENFIDAASIRERAIEHKNIVYSEHRNARLDIMQRLNFSKSYDDILIAEFTHIFNGVVLDVSSNEIDDIKASLFVKDIYPNYQVKTCLNSSVPFINVDDVWQIKDEYQRNITGINVTVAVIDTGVDYNHPDLVENMWVNPNEDRNHNGRFDNWPWWKLKKGVFGDIDNKDNDNNGLVDDVIGWDFVNKDNDPMDGYSHGTHCAGIIAGNGRASTGKYVGVAPCTKIYACKVLSDYGSGHFSDIIAGIERAVDPNNDSDPSDHVDIISISLGGYGNPDDPVCQAVDNAVECGVVVVVAAGNEGPSEETISSPACARKVITVGSSTHLTGSKESGGPDKIAFYSSRGPTSIGTIKPDILAPGGDVNRDAPESKVYEYGIVSCRASETEGGNPIDEYYTKASGTSMACPHIAGVVALLKQAHPDWNPDEIKMTLRNTAVDLGYNLITQGYGRVDALNAVNLTEAPPIAELLTSGKIHGININVAGTAMGYNFTNYSLYQQRGRNFYFDDDGNYSWIKIYESETQIDNDILFSWNISSLHDGEYTLKLVVNSQHQQSEDRVIVNIENTEITYPKDLIEDWHWLKGFGEVIPSWKKLMINGTSTGYKFDHFTLEWKKEGNNSWSNQYIILLDSGLLPVEVSTLGVWNVSYLTESDFYYLRLSTYHNGRVQTDEIKIWIDVELQEGWPKKLPRSEASHGSSILDQPTIADIDNDGKNDLVFAYGTLISVYRYDGSNVEGWPKEIETWYNKDKDQRATLQRGPAVADLDNDGFNEIVIGDNAGYLHVLNHDGSYVDGWSKKIRSNYLITPTIADIDNDGKLDIIIGDWRGYLHVLNSDGSYVKGWPKRLRPSYIRFKYLMIDGPPCVADIDYDGFKEIVVVSSSYRKKMDTMAENESSRIWVLNHDGTRAKGWPKEFYNGGLRGSHPALADIDGDNEIEIIIGSYTGKIYVWNLDGSPVDGWPVIIENGEDLDYPTIGDIDNDGNLEILISALFDNRDRKLFAFNSDGTIIDGWPRPMDYNITTDPKNALLGNLDQDEEIEISTSMAGGVCFRGDLVNFYAYNPNGSIVNGFPKKIDAPIIIGFSPVGDLDNDGDNELITVSENFIIYVWDLNASSEHNEWPEILHDEQHSGLHSMPSLYIGFSKPQEGRIYLRNLKLIRTLLGRTYIFGSITIEAVTGKDTSKVEFYVDGKLKETINEEPFEWEWKRDYLFRYKRTLKVIAYDSEGNSHTDTLTVWRFL